MSDDDTRRNSVSHEQLQSYVERIEQHDGFIIAATNFGEEIDPAIWRRFDMHMTLHLPGPFERARIVARYLDPFGLPDDALAQLAEALEGASPALIRQLCEGMKRQVIIGPKLELDMRCPAVIDRLVAAIHPHPTLGRPRLWSKGGTDPALRALTWPLPLAKDIPDDAPAPVPPADDKVVELRGRRP